MSFGVYVHIPYCLQRCTYCDFATYEQSQIMPPAQYFELLAQEIRQKASAFPKGHLSTVYFGGGTPSLVPAEHIVSLLGQLTSHGFTQDKSTEITIEINPATVDPKKMEQYLKAGVNRFSVGAQTFDDALLKSVHREHNSQQTLDTLHLLKSYDVNFSMDLLFALPGQTLQILERDLRKILEIAPPHISPYCLTVPEGHVLSAGRPMEEVQLQMFEMIREALMGAGFGRYEISNFAQPGFESKHNSLYWDDENYWGIGLSAHSYDRRRGWGTRYWNASAIGLYESQIKAGHGQQFTEPEQNLPQAQFERLEKHQSLTDFCHTSLRRDRGLLRSELQKKFGHPAEVLLSGVLAHQVETGLLRVLPDKSGWTLTEEGLLLSNQVFGALTFLAGEVG